MKTRILLTGIAAVALLTVPLAARAADMSPPSYQAPSYVMAPHGWTGL
jgi:hypothetical protein